LEGIDVGSATAKATRFNYAVLSIKLPGSSHSIFKKNSGGSLPL